MDTRFDFNPQDKKAEIENLVKQKTGHSPIWGVCCSTRIAFTIPGKLTQADKEALENEIKNLVK